MREPTEAVIEGNLGLQDELVEERHEHEGDPEYEEHFDELVYEHDSFYSDLTHESPYNNHVENLQNKTWLER